MAQVHYATGMLGKMDNLNIHQETSSQSPHRHQAGASCRVLYEQRQPLRSLPPAAALAADPAGLCGVQLSVLNQETSLQTRQDVVVHHAGSHAAYVEQRRMELYPQHVAVVNSGHLMMALQIPSTI